MVGEIGASDVEAATPRPMHEKRVNERNSIDEKSPIFMWPTRDVQMGLFTALPKRKGDVEREFHAVEEEQAPSKDVESKVELARTSNLPAVLDAVLDANECRRILNDAGWNISQCLRKNGKVQWYHRSPDGRLLGSLPKAMAKWRHMNEDRKNDSGVDNKIPVAMAGRDSKSKKRLPTKSAKENIRIASPPESTKERGEEIDRMQQRITGHDNGGTILGSGSGSPAGTLDAVTAAEGKGSSAILKSEQIVSRFSPGRPVDDACICPVAILSSKRDGMQTDQPIVDEVRYGNELNHATIQASSSEKQSGWQRFIFRGSPIGEPGAVLSGAVSPMQNASFLESNPRVKIEEDCALGRGANDDSPLSNSPANSALTPPIAWTDHSGNEVKEKKPAPSALQPTESSHPHKINLPTGKSPNGSFPFFESAVRERRHVDLVGIIETVKEERRDDREVDIHMTSTLGSLGVDINMEPTLGSLGVDINMKPTLGSLERTEEEGEKHTLSMELTRTGVEKGHSVGEDSVSLKSQALDSSNLPHVLDDDESRRVLRTAGWNISQCIRKNGGTQWYYRSPNGRLSGSLSSALAVWRTMQEMQKECSASDEMQKECSVSDENPTPHYNERNPKARRGRPRKLSQTGMQIVSPSFRGLKTESGQGMDQIEPSAAMYVNGDMICKLETPNGTHDMCTRFVDDRFHGGAPNWTLQVNAMESGSLAVEDRKDLKRKRQESPSADQRELNGSMCREGPIPREPDSVGGEVSRKQNSTQEENMEVYYDKALDDINVEHANVSSRDTNGGMSQNRNDNWTSIKPRPQSNHLLNPHGSMGSLCQSTS